MRRSLPRVLGALQRRLDGFLAPALRHAARSGTLDLRPYCGFGTPSAVTLQGRVLRPYGLPRGAASDPAWLNFLRTTLRLLSREVAGVPVSVRLGESRAQTVTGEDGYFEVRLSPPRPLSGPWQRAEVTLPGHGESATAPVRVVERAACGVISDLDDTVIRTGVTRLWQMLDTVLLKNSRTRLPFAGVSELYRALVDDPDGRGNNPVFYVSSSPWNLYGLLWRFLRRREVPLGPLFLRDWGLRTLTGSHGDHKLEAIARLMTTYPDLPFVLIGDSGQEDPTIYREVARRFPGRVRAVYIRDVTGSRRHAKVVRLCREAQAEGLDLRLAQDSLAVAQHAHALGLIPAGSLSRVTAGVTEDRAARGAH